MDRRQFLRTTAASAATLSLGPAFWRTAMSKAAVAGTGPYEPYGPLPDVNGLLLPPGFTSRVVARSGLPVEGTTSVRPIFPDGSGTFRADGDGWILVTNSENPPPSSNTHQGPAVGGASAIRFDRDGNITAAYPVLTNTRANCAGSETPWGTWLSCEEHRNGLVWECDPTGATPAVARPRLGRFMHEAADVDAPAMRVYLTEDEPNGLFYRFTMDNPRDLSAGVLEAAKVDQGGAVTWIPVPDPTGANGSPIRSQVPGATPFDGGEGCRIDPVARVVYISTKGDNVVRAYDIRAETMSVVYDGDTPLRGVDTLTVSPFSGDVFVAEDGGNMEVVVIAPDGSVSPFLRMFGPQHGTDGVLPDGQPDTGAVPRMASEVSGLAFSPDGTRLYVNSQRGFSVGVTYEVSGPFRRTRAGGA